MTLFRIIPIVLLLAFTAPVHAEDSAAILSRAKAAASTASKLAEAQGGIEAPGLVEGGDHDRQGGPVGVVVLGGRPRWLGIDIGRRQFYRILDAVLGAGS